MLRVRDIMTTDVITVAPELSVRDAMDLLTSRHISGAPVVANHKVVGVVSLTDLAELAATSSGVPTERPDVAEWGAFENPSDWIDEDNPPSAFFAEMWDDSGVDSVDRMNETSSPEWNDLEEHIVAEAMNRKIASLPPDTPVDHAAAMMLRAGIHRVLVMRGQELLGIVSTKDVSDAVAEHRVTTNVYVFGSRAGDRGP